MSDSSSRTLLVVADVGGRELHVGDEAMLQANLDRLRQSAPDVRIALVAPDGGGLRERLGVELLLEPPDAQGDCAASLQAELGRASGLLVSGGGNLCASWPELVAQRVALMRAARALGVPVALSGQTLGPELAASQRDALRETLAAAAFVGVRELPSAALAAGLGVGAERLWYQADDALWLRAEPPKGVALPPWFEQPWIAVTLDASFAAEAARDALRRIAAELARLAQQSGAPLLFIPHVGVPGAAAAAGDGASGQRLQALLAAHGTPLAALPVLEPRAAAWVTQRSAAVVSSRYHPLVFATAAAVPAIGIYRDAYTRIKLQGALEHFGLAQWALPSSEAEAGGLARCGLELWRQRHALRPQLAGHRRELGDEEQRRWSALLGALGLGRDAEAEATREALGRPARALLRPLLAALEREREAAASERGQFQSVLHRWNRAAASDALLGAPRRTCSRERVIDDARWADYLRDGYLKLGRVASAPQLESLRRRADELALGTLRNPAVELQLDTGGAYEALPQAARAFEQRTLLYRKIQGLQHDALFSELLQLPLFAEICAFHYGPHAATSVFRAMVMNKPAGQGTHLPWHQDGGDVWKLDRDPLVTVWVALDPATRASGCIEVIPGSHRLGLLSRAGSTLGAADVERHCPAQRITPLEVEAGEALLLHNWLIHRSGVNPSPRPRRAFTACYMDARTLSTLTGERFPLVFADPLDAGSPGEVPAHPFLQQLREQLRNTEEWAHSAQAYAQSLLATNAELQRMREAAEAYAHSLERERCARAGAPRLPAACAFLAKRVLRAARRCAGA